MYPFSRNQLVVLAAAGLAVIIGPAAAESGSRQNVSLRGNISVAAHVPLLTRSSSETASPEAFVGKTLPIYNDSPRNRQKITAPETEKPARLAAASLAPQPSAAIAATASAATTMPTTKMQIAVAAGVATSNQKPLPTAPTAEAAKPVVATPSVLGSRHQDSILLAQLAADLDKADNRLNAANATLSEGQRQLASFGDVLRQAMLEAGSEAGGLHPFVKVAQRYAGTPYVWGGESSTGFDCSGFIIRVMRDLGYKALPHSAAEQFNYGKPIADPLLKPGDLVFFANTYKAGVSHVGIYLGRRRFIHAAGTGKGTIVSCLDDAHFQAHYVGARRLNTMR